MPRDNPTSLPCGCNRLGNSLRMCKEHSNKFDKLKGEAAWKLMNKLRRRLGLADI